MEGESTKKRDEREREKEEEKKVVTSVSPIFIIKRRLTVQNKGENKKISQRGN